MTLGLLRAVRRTLANHNTYSDVLEGAYDATIAEIRKRRKESPWKGPFKVGHIDVLDSHLFKAARDVSFEQNQSKNIAAALNAYYGYTADGKDILEGWGYEHSHTWRDSVWWRNRVHSRLCRRSHCRCTCRQ